MMIQTWKKVQYGRCCKFHISSTIAIVQNVFWQISACPFLCQCAWNDHEQTILMVLVAGEPECFVTVRPIPICPAIIQPEIDVEVMLYGHEDILKCCIQFIVPLLKSAHSVQVCWLAVVNTSPSEIKISTQCVELIWTWHNEQQVARPLSFCKMFKGISRHFYSNEMKTKKK